jgi:hypothetical protein
MVIGAIITDMPRSKSEPNEEMKRFLMSGDVVNCEKVVLIFLSNLIIVYVTQFLTFLPINAMV